MADSVARLLSQLEEDRRDLLRGDFRRVLAAQERRSAILEDLPAAGGVSVDRLRAVKERAASNSRLLQAAVQGFGDAKRRRDRAGSPLTTYSAMGGRRAHLPERSRGWDSRV